MDTVTHFLLVLAAVLIIVCCLVWLAGVACLWGHSKRIRKDIDTLFQDLQDIAKVAKKFLGGLAERAEQHLETHLGSEGYTPAPPNFPPPEYPPENDGRDWRGPSSQYHFPYFE